MSLQINSALSIDPCYRQKLYSLEIKRELFMIPPFDRNRRYFKHQHTFDIKAEGIV